MKIPSRPTDMLLRQMAANRAAARYRNPQTKRGHFAHLLPYRPHFVREIVEMRRELRARAAELGRGKG